MQSDSMLRSVSTLVVGTTFRLKSVAANLGFTPTPCHEIATRLNPRSI